MKVLFAIVIFCAFAATNAADLCSTCKIVATTIKFELSRNATQEKIEEKVLSVCKLLPASLSQECISLVQANFHTIIELVIKLDSPAKICEEIGFCNKTTELLANKVGNFDKCSICHFLVGLGEAWLEKNTTELKLVLVLEDACAILPQTFSAVCKQVLNTYGQSIIKTLLNKENPDTVCKQIHICTSVAFAQEAPVFPVRNTAECFVCKFVITYLEKFIVSNSTESEIIKEAEKVCTVLPESLQLVCKILVEQQLPRVLGDIINKMPPSLLCSQLGFCPNSTLVAFQKQKIHQVQANPNACKVCQLVVATAESFLSSNTTQTEIIALGEKLCTVLPINQEECKAIVETALPSVIQYIITKETPDVVCAKLCSSQKDMLKLTIN